VADFWKQAPRPEQKFVAVVQVSLEEWQTGGMPSIGPEELEELVDWKR